MVLGGLAAAAGGLASGNNWVEDDVLATIFVGSRENRAFQKFDKRLKAIDFKIQRQQLHREDIRDLVELTTARMDVYHIVGTLLLTFCISWYTDNSMMRNKLPIWFADLFLISNFAAVGYLILSVWLAMYAAIASRSIGTRLLTSFARLSIPTESEINDIRYPIFFYVDDLFKRKVLRRQTPTSIAASQATTGSGELVTVDDQQHFRRFLQELPRWFSYDLYSRVCMSFGMNQMLQALSYYVLGVIWNSSPMAAATSFLAVRCLSMLIFWLDVGNDLQGGFKDQMALVLLHFGPPLLAALLLYSTIEPWWLHADAQHVWDRDYKRTLSFLATLCFWGHAGWLWYMTSIKMVRAGTERGSFKPGTFLNVLEWVNTSPVRKDFMEYLLSARRELLNEMEAVMQRESAEGRVCPTGRRSERLQELSAELLKSSEVLKPLVDGDPQPVAVAELRLSEEVGKRYEVWARALDVLVGLQALQRAEVQAHLTRSERRAADAAKHAFLELCQKHRLGLFAEAGSKRCSAALCRVGTRPGEEKAVLLEKASGRGEPVWINLESGMVSSTAPVLERPTASFDEVVNVAFPLWQTDACSLDHSSNPTSSSDPHVDGAMVDVPLNGGHSPGEWAFPVEMELKAAPDDLPVRLVRYFSMGTVLWWMVSGCAHAAVVLYDEEGALARLANQTFPTEESVLGKQSVHVQWPEPAHLFQVDSLQCDGARVWVSNKFSLFAASQTVQESLLEDNATSTRSKSLGTLTEVRDGNVGAVLCRGVKCDVLLPPEDTGPWLLESLEQLDNASRHVILPSSWRRVAGKWADCQAGANPSCDYARLAGWDGTTVFVAALQWLASSGVWNVHTRFELDPSLGDRKTYDDVKALDLAPDGRSLMVLLSDGVVDVWDLAKGKVHGRLQLRSDYSSMCRSRERLYLARQDIHGPSLVAVQLPLFVTELLQNASSGLAAKPEHGDFNAKSELASAPVHHVQEDSSSHKNPTSASSEQGSTTWLGSRQQRFLGPAMVQMDRIIKRFGQGVLTESYEFGDVLTSEPSAANSNEL